MIFDLDGTLISENKTVDYKKNSVTYSAIKRPGIQELLQFCLDNYKVGVWSLGTSEYVHRMVDKIFPRPPDFILDRNASKNINGRLYKCLNSCPWNKENLLVIDDTLEVFRPEDRKHVVLVPRYIGDVHDTVSSQLITYLARKSGRLPLDRCPTTWNISWCLPSGKTF